MIDRNLADYQFTNFLQQIETIFNKILFYLQILHNICSYFPLNIKNRIIVYGITQKSTVR